MNPLEIVRATRLDGLSVEERARAMRAFARLEARLAQLELIAERARDVVQSIPRDGGFPSQDSIVTLGLALTDLDHHPDTRSTPVETSPEATARDRWPAWRDQRGPSIREEG